MVFGQLLSTFYLSFLIPKQKLNFARKKNQFYEIEQTKSIENKLTPHDKSRTGSPNESTHR
jgi:hypothetical protein